ncbi:HepT-like ribonuclease domain-containing protein [uncultured Imperialibacter sp.]|uniref:HepT-like ribonuclease domain-containing protein n=1 Tax=uncultured Imperialibacter sp. TaxID=1672639 RepID=UPI0030DDA8ED
MTDKERKYLSDILSSIRLVYSFTENINSFDEYSTSYMVKSAVERQLGIIGEAVNLFIKNSDDSPPLNNAKQIISLRNRLVHSYDNIDDRIIWNIIRRHLSPLEDEVVQLLSEA